jgi:hypothetical protein
VDRNDNESFFALFNEGDNDDGFDLSCAEFVYPITATNADGNTLIVNDEDELEAAILDALNTENLPILAFPLQVLSDDDSLINLTDEEEFCTLFEDR